MDISVVSGSVAAMRGAVQLLVGAGNSGAGRENSVLTPLDNLWDLKSSASIVSAQAIAKIQELSARGAASLKKLEQTASVAENVTFTPMGGSRMEVPADEYEFYKNSGHMKSLEDVHQMLVDLSTDGWPRAISEALSKGRTELAEQLKGILSSFQKALSEGTLVVKMLDIENSSQFTTLRDGDGVIKGSSMAGPSYKQEDLLQAYGNGTELDKNVMIGTSYFVRGWIAVWDK